MYGEKYSEKEKNKKCTERKDKTKTARIEKKEMPWNEEKKQTIITTKQEPSNKDGIRVGTR